ncbi:CLUMA_CG011840, isoform A [Clunio marinus]|uniref:CLUMA_CG011840, isoform A n=1 Tax=Clunio marinus TaxID=568069 RepID=A0A1J1IE49_9DIPT|nr:CLUMA_CG011840, isoform A [Clunio marinus]
MCDETTGLDMFYVFRNRNVKSGCLKCIRRGAPDILTSVNIKLNLFLTKCLTKMFKSESLLSLDLQEYF